MQFQVQGKGGLRPELVFETGSESALFTYAKEKQDYKGGLAECFYLPSMDGESQLLIGLGKEEELTLDGLRKTFHAVGQLMQSHKETALELHFEGANGLCHGRSAMAIAEGFLLSGYKFDKYLSEKKDASELTVHYWPIEGKEEKVKGWIERAEKIYGGIALARDLVNERSNVIYPETLAQAAQEHLEPLGVKVTVYDEDQIQEMGMEAFYSVAKGSDRPPRFIVMEYKGDPSSDERTGLVGKGLTYDSGGYSMKPTSGMLTMNADMGGSGTVIGTLYALASLQAKVNVVGVVAAAENLVSGKAYKPGDIIGSMSGKTIEISNTDAEGRVTLADAMWYATHELKVDRVIDLATLTGACVVALGDEITGAITNDQTWMDAVLAAAKDAGEKMWQMPSFGEFAERNKSKVADLNNSGPRGGGMMSAGEFVGAFVDGSTPWVHLDIAGSAWYGEAKGYYTAGATGIHVRTLTYLLADLKC